MANTIISRHQVSPNLELRELDLGERPSPGESTGSPHTQKWYQWELVKIERSELTGVAADRDAARRKAEDHFRDTHPEIAVLLKNLSV